MKKEQEINGTVDQDNDVVVASDGRQTFQYYAKGVNGRKEDSIVMEECHIANKGKLVDKTKQVIDFDRFKAFGTLARALRGLLEKDPAASFKVKGFRILENNWNDRVFVDCNIQAVAGLEVAKQAAGSPAKSKRPYGNK